MRADTNNAVTEILDGMVRMAECALQNALWAMAKHSQVTMSKRPKRLMAAVMRPEPFVQGE